jgi:hypothetical protein
MALVILAATAGKARWRPILLAGFALGAATLCSPILGVAFSAAFGLGAAALALFEPKTAALALLRHAVAAGPVLGAVLWLHATGATEGGAGAVAVGFGGLARHAPLASLAMSLGPVLALVAVALAMPRRLPRAALPAVAALVVGLTLYYVVFLPLDLAYVGFRAGQVLQMASPALIAVAIAAAWTRAATRAAMAIALAAAVVIGAPTTIIDWFNAQDTGNRDMAPGFHWTLVVTPAEQEAFAWLRAHTRPDAVVQLESVTRGRDAWSVIPSFAERRMAASPSYPMIPRPEFMQLAQQAQRIYAAGDAQEAWTVARRLGVDYVYVDRVERAAYPAALARFDAARGLFRRVFANDEVAIFAVESGPKP